MTVACTGVKLSCAWCTRCCSDVFGLVPAILESVDSGQLHGPFSHIITNACMCEYLVGFLHDGALSDQRLLRVQLIPNCTRITVVPLPLLRFTFSRKWVQLQIRYISGISSAMLADGWMGTTASEDPTAFVNGTAYRTRVFSTSLFDDSGTFALKLSESRWSFSKRLKQVSSKMRCTFIFIENTPTLASQFFFLFRGTRGQQTGHDEFVSLLLRSTIRDSSQQGFSSLGFKSRRRETSVKVNVNKHQHIWDQQQGDHRVDSSLSKKSTKLIDN